MTTPVMPTSTPESRTAALSMFAGQVPCVFSLAEPECTSPAKWLIWFEHEENQLCQWDEPWPVCPEHKRMIQGASHPFWRTWNKAQPIDCGACQTPLRVIRYEPIE